MASIRKNIALGVVYSSAGNLIIKILAAFGYFLIIRQLSLHDYGIFVLLTSVIGPISALVFFSYDRIFVAKYSQARADGRADVMKGLFREYYAASAALTCMLLIAGYAARTFIANEYDVYLVQFFWGTAAFVLSQIIMNQVSLFLEANEKFKEISMIQAGESILRVIIVVAAYYSFGFSVTSILLMYAAAKIGAAALGALYAIPLIRTLAASPERAAHGVIRSLFVRVGKWEMGRDLMERVLQPIKPVLIKFFVSIEGVAVYDFARNIYVFMSSLLPVSKVIFPIVARSVPDKAKIHLIVAKAQKYTFLAFLPIYAAALVCTGPVLAHVFPQYLGSELIIFLMLLHFVTDVYKLGQTSILYAFDRQKFTFFVTPFFMISLVVLDVILVRALGIYGIALSWHAQALLTGFVNNVYIHRSVGIPRTLWSEIFRFDAYDRVVLGGVKERFRKFVRRPTS